MSLGRLNHSMHSLRRAPLASAGLARWVTAGAVLAAALASSSEANAAGPVGPDYKGTVGGAFLGAEVIVIPMGAAGVNKGWPYFVFGGLGAVGGAVGGYFLDQHFNGQGGPAEPSVYMLAGGMALIIPALVVSLNATAYRPPDGDRVEPANNRPAAEPPTASPDAPPPAPPPPTAPGASYQYRSRYRAASAAMPHIPTSLLDVYAGKLGAGLPAPQVRQLYTQAEMSRYGVSQGTEIQFPFIKAMF
jgi:hypothetical protein